MSRRQGHRPRLGVVSTLTDINLASRAVVSNRPDKRCRGRPTGSHRDRRREDRVRVSKNVSMAIKIEIARKCATA